MERISLHSAQGQRPLPHNSHLKLKHLSQAQLRDRGGGAAARIGSVPIHTPISSTLLLISHADAFSGQLGSSGWGRELQKHSLSSLLFCLIFPHPTLGAQMGASTGDNLGKGIKKGIGNPIKSLKSPPALLSRAKSPPSFRRLVPPLFALWSPPHTPSKRTLAHHDLTLARGAGITPGSRAGGAGRFTQARARSRGGRGARSSLPVRA